MVEIHVPLQPPENPQIPAGPGSSPQTRRHPRSWPRTPGGQNPPAPLLRLRSGGVRGLYLEFGGPVLGFSGPARGPRRGCARGARSFHSRTLGARGHSERRTWGAATLGFRPWRTGRAGFPARGRGAPGRADPRGGCSRGRVGDSCARSIPAPARAPSPPRRRAAPSRPHRSRAAPPAALSANTANVCAGHRGWASAAGAGGVPGARVLVPHSRPRSSASAGPRNTRDPVEGIPPPNTFPQYYSGVGGSGRSGAGLQGAQTAGLQPAQHYPRLSFPLWRVTRSGWGIPGRPRSLALLPPPPPALAFSPRQRSGVGLGAGLSAGAPDAEVANMVRPGCRRCQKGLGTRMRPRPSAPDPSSLGFVEITSRSRRYESIPQFAAGETEARRGRERAAASWRMGEGDKAGWELEGAPLPNSADRAGPGHCRPRTSPAQRNPRRAPRSGGAHAPPPPRSRGPPAAERDPRPLAPRAPSGPSRNGGSFDN